MQAVTIAYDLEDHRSWWQHRLLGLGLTTAGVLVLAVLLPLLVVGPEAGEVLGDRFGLARAFKILWQVLYFPFVLAFGVTLLAWVYHIVPPQRTTWRRDVPGAVLAFVIWLAGSFALPRVRHAVHRVGLGVQLLRDASCDIAVDLHDRCGAPRGRRVQRRDREDVAHRRQSLSLPRHVLGSGNSALAHGKGRDRVPEAS